MMGTTGMSTTATATLLNGLDRFLKHIEVAMMALVCLCLFAIMVLVSLDAVSRYALNSPLIFTFDLVEMYFLPGALFLSLSMTMRARGHIAVDLFANMMPPRVYLTIIGVGLLASTVLIGVMADRVIARTHESWDMDLVVTGLYAWPIWLGEGVVAFALAVLTLRVAHLGLANLAGGLFGLEGVAVPLLHTPEDPMEEPV